MEGSRYSNRKRSRSHLEVDESVEFEATPAQGSEEFEHIHKKRRTSSPKTVLEAGKHAVKTVYNKFWGFLGYFSGNMAQKEQKRNDLNIENDDDLRIVHDSRQAKSSKDRSKTPEDEIQFVEEVIVHSPDFEDIRFQPPGHSTVISSAMKSTRPFIISTREKLHHDRLERNKKGIILQKIREKSITARRTFELSPSNWRTPYASGIGKTPTLLRRRPISRSRPNSGGTPRGYEGRMASFRPTDHEKYKFLLENQNSSPLVSFVDKSRIQSRSPIFNRSEPINQPIQRSYLKDPSEAQKLIEQLEKHQKKRRNPEVITLDESLAVRPQISSCKDDRDVIEILDIVSPPRSPKSPKRVRSPINTLQSEHDVYDICGPNYLEELRQKYDRRKQDREILIEEERTKASHAQDRSEKLAKCVEERMRKHLAITEVAIPEPEEESDSEEEAELPELTPEMESEIDTILRSPQNLTLVEAYNIPITRKDLDTLRGLNWLNDEIINFYLQMIVARSSNPPNENWAKVYAMNTFFLPKLRTSGYSLVKRWTRKVDIFSYDKIFVPVHLDVHWCLAVIDLKKKGVYFYDSMGSDKNDILRCLLKYLEQEHLDKKKSAFDTSDFELENVKDIPRQMNGSDCGMFTLKYSEYLSRNAGITFTQEDMPYFRRRMVYEIVKNNVIHP